MFTRVRNYLKRIKSAQIKRNVSLKTSGKYLRNTYELKEIVALPSVEFFKKWQKNGDPPPRQSSPPLLVNNDQYLTQAKRNSPCRHKSTSSLFDGAIVFLKMMNTLEG